jgi:hypothetical protein
LGAGIRVKKISEDYRELHVQMKLRWYNRNYVKTHFGGSLFSMTDPFLMTMLINILGKDYIVWDKSSCIDFVKPGMGTLTAKFIISENQIENIIKNTIDGKKYYPEFQVNVTDEKKRDCCQSQKNRIYSQKMMLCNTEQIIFQ